jgi:mannosyltransferase OCH1-like enzyme
MIPKIIHQTAPTKYLSPEEDRLRKRAMNVLKGWQFKLYDDQDNVGVILKAFPDRVATFRSIQRGVVRADIARYAYLYLFGGVYIDTDYKILRNIDDDVLNHVCVLPVSRSSDIGSPEFRLGNAILASEPRQLFWAEFISEIFAVSNLTKLPEHLVEDVTGPHGITRFYLNNKNKFQDVFLPSRELFHPKATMKGLSYKHSNKSYGVHLCWGSWRSKSLARRVTHYFKRKVTSF